MAVMTPLVAAILVLIGAECAAVVPYHDQNGNALPKEVVIVLKSASNIVNLIEDIVKKNDPNYANEVTVFQNRLPPFDGNDAAATKPPFYQKYFQTTTGSPKNGNNGGGSLLGSIFKIELPDLNAILSGTSQVMRSGGKCVKMAHELPPTDDHKETIFHTWLDSLERYGRSEDVQEWISDQPLIQLAIDLTVDNMKSLFPETSKSILSDNKTANQSSLESIFRMGRDVLDRAPNFGSCMLQENLSNPLLPFLMKIVAGFSKYIPK
ncbi:Uncharacterised protein g6609 [Pycnogonum litorale]